MITSRDVANGGAILAVWTACAFDYALGKGLPRWITLDCLGRSMSNKELIRSHMEWNTDYENELRGILLGRRSNWIEECSQFFLNLHLSTAGERRALEFVLGELESPELVMQNRWVLALSLSRAGVRGADCADLHNRILATCERVWRGIEKPMRLGAEDGSRDPCVGSPVEAMGFDLATCAFSVPGTRATRLLEEISRDLEGSIVASMIRDMLNFRSGN